MKLHHGEANVASKIKSPAFMRDGVIKISWFHAGLDATEGPPKYTSPLKMNASVHESHLKLAMATSVDSMSDGDALVMLSGKSKLVAKAMRQELATFKPKLFDMEPDESDDLKRLRTTRSKTGSIDLRETYFEARKREVGVKSQPRPFMPRNTAFVTMRPIPLLGTGAMAKAPKHDRECALRGVTGDDRFRGKVQTGGAEQAEEDCDEDAEMEECSEADANGNVLFFYMDLHPNICAQLVWECGSNVLLDFSLGAGMMVKTALLKNLKCLFVALTKDHMLLLDQVITTFVRGHMEAGTARFLGVDGEDRLKNTMPAKLLLWGKRYGNTLASPVCQQRTSPNWEVELAALADGGGGCPTGEEDKDHGRNPPEASREARASDSAAAEVRGRCNACVAGCHPGGIWDLQ